ncbi:hypothetical protein [Weissella cibaria]|uniref:hypothetical protein n=1 Tax=Weissella cibaria TaxID=137591 RepID=UPI001193A317|nr:hypothetical protein [Weissella cibaria]TVV32468.1 hypothetical protein FO434_09645 [Weissella cibaria]
MAEIEQKHLVFDYIERHFGDLDKNLPKLKERKAELENKLVDGDEFDPDVISNNAAVQFEIEKINSAINDAEARRFNEIIEGTGVLKPKLFRLLENVGANFSLAVQEEKFPAIDAEIEATKAKLLELFEQKNKIMRQANGQFSNEVLRPVEQGGYVLPLDMSMTGNLLMSNSLGNTLPFQRMTGVFIDLDEVKENLRY